MPKFHFKDPLDGINSRFHRFSSSQVIEMFQRGSLTAAGDLNTRASSDTLAIFCFCVVTKCCFNMFSYGISKLMGGSVLLWRPGVFCLQNYHLI